MTGAAGVSGRVPSVQRRLRCHDVRRFRGRAAMSDTMSTAMSNRAREDNLGYAPVAATGVREWTRATTTPMVLSEHLDEPHLTAIRPPSLPHLSHSCAESSPQGRGAVHTLCEVSSEASFWLGTIVQYSTDVRRKPRIHHKPAHPPPQRSTVDGSGDKRVGGRCQARGGHLECVDPRDPQTL
jgi:hypothetical protein